MEWSKALKAIADSGLENAPEIVEAIKGRFTEIGRAEDRVNQLEGLLGNTLDLLGAEGADMATRLENAGATIKSLQSQKADFENKYNDSQKEIGKLKRVDTIREAARAIGANPAVLATLLGNTDTEIVVKDGKPMFGDKELKAAIEESYRDFVPALFPAGESPKPPETPTNPLPGGSATPPKPPEPNDPAKTIEKRYADAAERIFAGGVK